MSKAFDTIDHNILLDKLKHYGIKGKTLQWFASYLTNRYQFVEFHDTPSDRKIINTGVPQGSILGPLLFMMYMNDIYKVTTKFHFILYADDTSLIEPLCTFEAPIEGSIGILSNKINLELQEISPTRDRP